MTDHEQQLDEREVDGRRFWYRPGTVDEVILAEAYQQARFTVPDLAKRTAPVVVDVGAHIGCLAVIMAAHLPRATVFALEPAVANFDLLTRNIAANGLSNVVPLQVALAGRSGVATLHHAAANWGHSLHPELAVANGPAEPAEDVMVLTLDEFMRRNGLSWIDHLKMNIEGAEYEVLLGSSPRLLSTVGRVEVEFHPVPTADGHQLAGWLSQCGFAVEATWSVDEAGKGWIHATRPRPPASDQVHRAARIDASSVDLGHAGGSRSLPTAILHPRLPGADR